MEDVVAHWVERSTRAGSKLNGSFRKVLKECAGALWKGEDGATSVAWNEEVHGDHDQFEYVPEPQDDHAVSMVYGCLRVGIGE